MRSLFFVSALAIALLAAYAGATTYPLTLTDDLGRSVTIEAEPQRVVTLMPSHTETVCAMGACGRLVGRDRFSNFPAEVLDLPDLGSPFSADLEAIVALEPDLVLVDEFSGVAASLEVLGLTVYAGTPQTLDEVLVNFTLVGKMLNRETEAALLSDRVRGEIAALEDLVLDQPSPRVYLELDATPYSVGPDSFIGILMVKAGGANIVPPTMGDFPQLDPEFVVISDPEVIVLMDAPFGESLATIRERPGWTSLTAIRLQRVAELESAQVDILSRPGPRVAEAVRLLAHLFHPDLF